MIRQSTIMLMLLVLLVGGAAQARISVSSSVASIAGAPVSAVATIVDSKVTGQRQQGNQRVETLRVTARVELAFKGSKRGARLRFVHWRAKATGPVLNGLHYPELKRGRAYLLGLVRRGKALQRFAPEDAPVEISKPALRARPTRLAGPPARGVMALLEAQISHCSPGCGRAIWLLAGAPRALRIPDKRLVALLLPVARASKDRNTRLAAYSTLGSLGQTAVIPEIVSYCAGKAGRSDHRANSVSWLQGFAKPAQIGALKQILARSNDPAVRRVVTYRLSHLTR